MYPNCILAAGTQAPAVGLSPHLHTKDCALIYEADHREHRALMLESPVLSSHLGPGPSGQQLETLALEDTVIKPELTLSPCTRLPSTFIFLMEFKCVEHI